MTHTIEHLQALQTALNDLALEDYRVEIVTDYPYPDKWDFSGTAQMYWRQPATKSGAWCRLERLGSQMVDCTPHEIALEAMKREVLGRIQQYSGSVFDFAVKVTQIGEGR